MPPKLLAVVAPLFVINPLAAVDVSLNSVWPAAAKLPPAGAPLLVKVPRSALALSKNRVLPTPLLVKLPWSALEVLKKLIVAPPVVENTVELPATALFVNRHPLLKWR